MTAQEDLFGSRLATVGVDGTSFTRVFLVEDPVDDNGNVCDATFDATLRTLAGLGSDLAELPGANAVRYRKTKVLSPTQFKVEVDYEPPTVGAGATGWQLEVTSSPFSEHVKTVPLTAAERGQTHPPIVPTIIGPYRYQRVDSFIGPIPADRLFRAGDTELFLPEKPEREPVGMDRDITIVSIVARKLFPISAAYRVIKLMHYMQGVNEFTMFLLGKLLFRAGQLKMEGLRSSFPIVDGVEGQDVSVAFAARADGWQFDSVHTYTDPDALGKGETVVMTDREGLVAEPVEETFKRQFVVNFDGVLESI